MQETFEPSWKNHSAANGISIKIIQNTKVGNDTEFHQRLYDQLIEDENMSGFDDEAQPYQTKCNFQNHMC